MRDTISKRPNKIIISVGEFTNLTKDIILHTLETYIPEIYELNINFEYYKGEIKCHECNHIGPAGKIFADKYSHSEVIVGCQECNSINTEKISGRNLLITYEG